MKVDYTLQYIRSAFGLVENLLRTDWTPDSPGAPVKDLRVRMFLLREQLSLYLENGDKILAIKEKMSDLAARAEVLLRDFSSIYSMTHQDFLRSPDAVPNLRTQFKHYVERFEALEKELSAVAA